MIEIEGPIQKDWPPPSHRALFFTGKNGREITDTKEIVAHLLPRAYRRPVTREEIADIVAVVKDAQRSGKLFFPEAMRLGLQRVLCAPGFLFLEEPACAHPQARPLADYDLASRLSYFLWSTMPDEELFALAAAGKLREPTTVAVQVRRMVADPKANQLVTNFAGQWLSVRDYGSVQPAADYKDYDKSLEQAAKQEPYAFFADPDQAGLDYRRYQRLLFDVIALALQTDSTRVIAYMARLHGQDGTGAWRSQGNPYNYHATRSTPPGMWNHGRTSWRWTWYPETGVAGSPSGRPRYPVVNSRPVVPVQSVMLFASRNLSMKSYLMLPCSIGLLLAAAGLARPDVILAERGPARCLILAPARVMEPDRPLKAPSYRERETEAQRRRFRESVKDLARVLGVMTGATIEVCTGDRPANDPRVPIFIGERAQAVFGPPGKTAPYRQGCRYTVALLCTRTAFNELGTGGLLGPVVVYAEKAPQWLPATAHLVPKETAPEGEGYFSIVEGKNGKLYIGTHANGVNAWLVEFDPTAKKMKVVVDVHKAIGKDLKGFAAQSKIHTRNNVGASGKIYFGTKQGYPAQGEKREDYPGGYPMVYDPATGTTKVYPIPVPHQGINSIMPDESRGIAYISTCSDGRPGPGENAVFLILDLKTGKYRELIDTQHIYGFIVLDHLGRAYHPLLGGRIARYDPRTNKLEKLKQTIDGRPPAPDLHLADRPRGHPLNWEVSPDGKTLYCVPMSTNHLFAYDLTAAGATLPGRDLGPLLPGAADTDCRALCVGPGGPVWASVTAGSAYPGVRLHHLVRYIPGDTAPQDLGAVSIRNPDYTSFTDKAGKLLPFHGGVFKTPDGVTTSRHVTLGICQTRAGGVYVLMLQPYTVLEVTPADLAAASTPAQPEELFVARPLTATNSFTAGIEGPACDAAGNLYVVNLKRNGDIARVTPAGKAEVFIELPDKSVGNGIVFDRRGLMYVADYVGHNVLRIDPKTKKAEVFAHEAAMNQPNDLAIAPDGTLYASDPNWAKSTGQLWKIGTGGKVTRVAADLGTTNGIEVSPDGKLLYVNESVQRNIWAFPIKPDGTLGAKRLLTKFDDHGFDGMRCDVDGNLYVTRYGKGTVVKLSPAGTVLKEIDVLGKSPSNLCFGGADGRTVYVTEVEHRRVVRFRVDRPGRAWRLGQK